MLEDKLIDEVQKCPDIFAAGVSENQKQIAFKKVAEKFKGIKMTGN